MKHGGEGGTGVINGRRTIEMFRHRNEDSLKNTKEGKKQ